MVNRLAHDQKYYVRIVTRAISNRSHNEQRHRMEITRL